MLSDWACPPNLPAPAHPPVLPWTNGRTWREWAKASSPGGLQPRLQRGPLPRPRAPAPPRPRAPALQRPGKSRRRKAGGSGTAGWAAAAPIGCAVVPSRAACPPPRAQPALAPSLGAGSRRREGAQGRDPSSRPAPDPGARGDKTGRRRAGARVRQPPERGEAGARVPQPLAARASAPRTGLRELGSRRAGTGRPERRDRTFSGAMKRAPENSPELAETLPAPGVAAAAAAP